jgi:hypothetical protein
MSARLLVLSPAHTQTRGPTPLGHLATLKYRKVSGARGETPGVVMGALGSVARSRRPCRGRCCSARTPSRGRSGGSSIRRSRRPRRGCGGRGRGWRGTRKRSIRRYNAAVRRRLPRILLNAATALSVALCLGTIVLWVRSYWQQYDVAATRTWRDGGEVLATTAGIRSEPGRLNFARGADVRSGRAVRPQDLQLPERAHAHTHWAWGSRPASPRPAPNAAAADGPSWTWWGLPRTRRLQGGRPNALRFSTAITRMPYY